MIEWMNEWMNDWLQPTALKMFTCIILFFLQVDFLNSVIVDLQVQLAFTALSEFNLNNFQQHWYWRFSFVF